MAPLGTMSNSKRARKDRCPNWTHQEVLALIAAKRDMFLEELDVVDGRDLMIPDNTKWMRISQEVMRAGFSACLRDGAACKTKWNQILPDYKRISDYLRRTGRNVRDYWDLSPLQRQEEGLPKQFSQEIFGAIDDWFGSRAQIQPPHVRDLLAPNDDNYQPQEPEHETAEDGNSEGESEDPMDVVAAEAVDTTEGNTPPRSPLTSSSTPAAAMRPSLSTGTPLSALRRPPVPPGITPHIISSSDTSSYSLGRRPGNTAVRRRSASGHTVIAEATKATGAVMAKQMQDIAESSRALERSKIDVQLQLFTEQMAYQREKDRRLYENGVAANENARLAIIKQGEIVHCLAHLSTVLGRTLTRSSSPEMDSLARQTTDLDNAKRMTQPTWNPTGNHGSSDGGWPVHHGIDASPTENREEVERLPQSHNLEQPNLPGTATHLPDDLNEPTTHL